MEPSTDRVARAEQNLNDQYAFGVTAHHFFRYKEAILLEDLCHKKEIAQDICRELGISWDEDAAVPMVDAQPVSETDLCNLFDVSSSVRKGTLK